MVWRGDEESLESGAGVERIVGGVGGVDFGGVGGVFNWDGNARVDREPEYAVRGYGIEADLWAGEPVWGDGAQLDDGQDRADLQVGGRYGAGGGRDVGGGWA